MTDAFISYSRRDTDYVRALAASLTEAGKDVWVDTEGIRDAERFPDALARAVESADAFVFVISPDSVASEYCEQEIALATELNKRIVPVALRPVPDDDIPDEVRYRNWIPVSTDEPGTDRIVAAIEADLGWDQQHTQITVRALQWDRAGRERSMLLRGTELASAEQWMAAGAAKDPGPTELDQQFILAGRSAASRRQRTLMSGMAAVAVIAIGLLIFALISRSEAVSAKTSAQSGELASESEVEQGTNPDVAILLAMAAVRERVSYGSNGTMFALRSALDAWPLSYTLPAAGDQNCQTLGPTMGAQTQEGGPGLAFAPGDRQIAEGLCDGDVRLIDPATRRIERSVQIQGSAIQLSYDADGGVLAVASSSGQLLAINPRTGRIFRQGPIVTALSQLVAVPHSDLVAFVGQSGTSSGIVEWDVRNGALRIVHYPGSVPGSAPADVVAFSPDGSRDVLGFNESADGGSTPGATLAEATPAHSGGPRRVTASSPTPSITLAFSPDGRELAVGTYPDSSTGAITILNARTLRRQRTLETLPGVIPTAIAFSADGSKLAYGTSAGSGAVLNAESGATIVKLSISTALISAIGFSADGQTVYTAATDGSLDAWRATSTARFASPVGEPLNPQIAASPGGGYETIGQDPGVVAQSWNQDGQRIGRPLVLSRSDAVNAAFLGGDGLLAGTIAANAADAAPIDIFDVRRRRLLASPLILSPSGAEPLVSPNGRSLVMTNEQGDVGDGALELVNLATGALRQIGLTSCAQLYLEYAFNASGTRVAAATACGEVSVHDTHTGRLISRFNTGGEIDSMALSPSGDQVAAGLNDGAISVHSAISGRLIANLGENASAVGSLAYSANGHYLASSGGVIRIFDAHTLAELRVIDAPADAGSLDATNVAFDQSSRDVLLLGTDNVVREYDACTDCQNPRALLALATRSVIGSLTRQQRAEFGVN